MEVVGKGQQNVKKIATITVSSTIKYFGIWYLVKVRKLCELATDIAHSIQRSTLNESKKAAVLFDAFHTSTFYVINVWTISTRFQENSVLFETFDLVEMFNSKGRGRKSTNSPVS